VRWQSSSFVREAEAHGKRTAAAIDAHMSRSPALLAANVACVDWGVASGGFLCAYRWDGEKELSADKIVKMPHK
jgi:hypothetical protein